MTVTVICTVCKTIAHGTKDDLINQGWTHAHGKLNQKILNVTLCPEHNQGKRMAVHIERQLGGTHNAKKTS